MNDAYCLLIAILAFGKFHNGGLYTSFNPPFIIMHKKSYYWHDIGISGKKAERNGAFSYDQATC
ncbi:hypothetical protein KM917_07070 [Virgibacillus pantothenticus]|uniref:hypothetical protein n=1 Tax=Virgibacillus TaxID=84406 RepID=UPI000A80E34D|nr:MULTISPECIES: hypothetical protein [Virgibacillus]MBU8646312.1 hypothetical protein [Virgibacillus pantothenticus]MBU8659960.1 hypothetical protein [Virgibacillus pantothenticus]MBU8668291.1 hypothetical protein [Virgibacillus pantothenticus]